MIRKNILLINYARGIVYKSTGSWYLVKSENNF